MRSSIRQTILDPRALLNILNDKIKTVSDIVENQPSNSMCGQVATNLANLGEKRTLLLAEVEFLEDRRQEGCAQTDTSRKMAEQAPHLDRQYF